MQNRIELPSGFQEKMLINAAANRLPPVGMPREEQDKPRTIRIMPDMSMLVWHYASVEARGGLHGPDGKPIMKLGLKVDWLDPNLAFDFFHRQSMNYAHFLQARDKALEEAENETENAETDEKQSRPPKKERKARRKKLKRGRR